MTDMLLLWLIIIFLNIIVLASVFSQPELWAKFFFFSADNETITTQNHPTSEPSNITKTDSTTTLTTASQIETRTNTPAVETPPPLKEVTLSNVRDVKVKNMEFSTGDRLILHLATPLTPNVDYTLRLAFSGQILNTLTGFYKSTYKEDNVDK